MNALAANIENYGGYSSAEMQQRQLSAAYAALQRQQLSGRVPIWASASATAVGHFDVRRTDPYWAPVTGTATVATEAKTVPQVRRRKFSEHLRYWTILAGLSVLSIWPAWGPVLFKTFASWIR
jgi:hypothetical protein